MASKLIKTPMYQQLNTILREMISSGECAPYTKFLTEREVADRFDVSRATANKALSSLVSEGLLEFRKGIGTFVRPGTLNADLGTLVSFTEKALLLGKKPATQVIIFENTSSSELPSHVYRELFPQDDKELIYTKRIRSADGISVIYEKRYIVSSLCPGLKKRDLKGSLYALFTERFSIEITGARQTIHAVAADEETAQHLGLTQGSPVLLVKGTGYCTNDELLWIEETCYRGDMYEFANNIGPFARGGPAVGRLI